MRQQGSVRALLGCAGLATCIGALVLHSPAGARALRVERPIVSADTAADAPHLFGTMAVPIKAQRFAAEWARARRDASWHPALQLLVKPARHLGKLDQIAFIQTAVSQQIRWRSDATEWGVHDYWASAVETLERGAGDMEDRAIVKMHALMLLGFPARDLYLTLGRDKVGGAMAVLIVRAGNGHYVLDDVGGAPVPADRRQGFTPMLSFAGSSSWAHAFDIPRAGSTLAAGGK